jgi:nicotinate-nucleotide adenylyltransferase
VRDGRVTASSFICLPPHAPGMRIGLFGGSFNPAHQGHLAVSRAALRRLRLDRLWWLVSPGNPLKDTKGLPPLAERIAAATSLARHPRIVVTGLEAAIGARYTCETIRFLVRRCPGVRFVWIMGADNLLQFDQWRDWDDIARMVPIAVVDRPGATLKTMSAKTAQRFASARIDESDATRFALVPPPAIIYLHGPRIALSSTALRGATAGPSD